MTMEELVEQLAELRIESESLAAQADLAVYHKGYDRDISVLEKKLNELKEFEKHVRFAYEWRIGELDTDMRDVSAQIVEMWDGEKKTMIFDAGTLKFRTTQSLKIGDEAWLLSELLRTMPCTGAVKYLEGFNSTAVKKFMGVHEIPAEAAELISKTTVKLDTI